jgi:hypothetical protein
MNRYLIRQQASAVFMHIAKSPSAGQFQVSFDYNAEIMVDGFSTTNQCAYAWSAFSLTDITHTVTVTTWDIGKTFELDHFL